jgi:hypothetical protein
VKSPPVLTADQKYDRALRLLSNTKILVQPCDISAAFLLHAEASREVKNKDLVLSVGQTGRSIREQIDEIDARLKANDDITPAVAIIRASAASQADRTFIDRPNVIHHTQWFRQEEGKRVSFSTVDLAFLSTAAMPGVTDAFAARLEQGVADTLAETLAMGSEASDENTVRQFDAAGKKGVAPVVVAASAPAALDALGMPDDTKYRVKADLAAGRTVVLASAEPGRWSWWQIDPATGQTVGVMDSGYNQAATEREIQEEIIAYNNCLGTKMTPQALREASKEQIAAWAKNHPGTMQNLQLIQADLRIHFGRMLATLARSGR